jgi:hypothetical protein
MPMPATIPTLADAYSWPQPTREEATQLVLDSLTFIFEELSESEELDTTAFYLAVRLRGPVTVSDVHYAFSLWLTRYQAQTGDLTFLFDAPNTPESRTHQVSVASGNLMASVTDILNKAGIR